MPIINSKNICGLIQRTLNHVDPRLIDHGVRVAALAKDLLKKQGKKSLQERQEICLLALLHDIGAYKTEEIDKMVQFETLNVWEHSVYGYLFLKNMSPLGEKAEGLLYHHVDYDALPDGDPAILEIAQLIHFSDRIDVCLGQDWTQVQLLEYLHLSKGTRFDPTLVDLFFSLEEDWNTPEKLREDFCIRDEEVPEQEVDAYLKMLTYAIDFRSVHTVTHTITTTSISEQLARLLGVDDGTCLKIHYGAMLHDLGKIGIPVEILEFPGKLSAQAMRIMRSHVDLTEEILGGSVEESVARIALRHHEKLNGGGYPRGLRAEELTLPERIVAVADIVSALCGVRSYKDAFPKEKVLHIVKTMSVDGLIDAQVEAVLRNNFDEVMDTVRAQCSPLLEQYAQMHGEYELFMQKRMWEQPVSGKRIPNLTRNG